MVLVWVGVCLVGVPVVGGAEFYVDLVAGSVRGDGSAGRPWRTIQEVFEAGLVASRGWGQLPCTDESELVVKHAGAPVQAGDTIWLRSGYHGRLSITGYYNAGDITLAAEEGHEPRLSSVRIRAGSNWVIRGLTISAEFGESYERGTLVDLDSHNWHGPVHDIVVEECAIRSVADTSGWTVADWNQLACNGVQVDGRRMTIRGNHLLNVNFGISVGASDSVISENVVENFAGDGLRGLGDRCTFEYNTVKNCYNVNGNHDDGFQSWSYGPDGVGSGEVVGIVLRGNTIINYEDPNQPHRGTLQGIGCFDGTFVDWVIENNVVIVDHWHGITLLGARNCLVINNTVVDRNDSRPGPPWICVGKHKRGMAPVDCVVRNNLAATFSSADEVLEDHNLRVVDPARLFVDAEAFDLHLLPDAAAVDAGSSLDAPPLDRDRMARPQGSGVDIGAYEWHAEDVAPEGARTLMDEGMLPPATGSKAHNRNWFQIDPQLVNEIWSAFYPGMTKKAVGAGSDCDNQASTCAGLTGVIHGASGIPDRFTKSIAPKINWKEPFNDHYVNSMRDGLSISNRISDIVGRIVRIAEQAIVDGGGKTTTTRGKTTLRGRM